MTDIQQAKSVPPRTNGPLCPKCRKARMELTRIMPDKPGIDCRTFECARCQHIETVLVSFV